MLDLKLLRNSTSEVGALLKRKGYDFDLDNWSTLENQRKTPTIRNRISSG